MPRVVCLPGRTVVNQCRWLARLGVLTVYSEQRQSIRLSMGGHSRRFSPNDMTGMTLAQPHRKARV